MGVYCKGGANSQSNSCWSCPYKNDISVGLSFFIWNIFGYLMQTNLLPTQPMMPLPIVAKVEPPNKMPQSLLLPPFATKKSNDADFDSHASVKHRIRCSCFWCFVQCRGEQEFYRFRCRAARNTNKYDATALPMLPNLTPPNLIP